MKLTYSRCVLVLLATAACGSGASDYVSVLGPTDWRKANAAVALVRSEGIDTADESRVGLITVFVPSSQRARAEEVLRKAGLL
jgi:type III secretory pathway lipoprotein EscJ